MCRLNRVIVRHGGGEENGSRGAVGVCVCVGGLVTATQRLPQGVEGGMEGEERRTEQSNIP